MGMMKTKLLLAAAVGVLLSGTANAQDGDLLPLGSFDSLDVGGQFELEVTVGPEASVRIDASDKDADELSIEVKNGELDIDQRARFLGRTRSLDARITVTMPSLEEAEFSRGIDAAVSGEFTAPLEIDVSTGALVSFQGTCDSLSLDVSTGGELEARGLECREVTADASTGGVAELYASERFSGDASMGGVLDVYGDPASFDAESSMGGDVTRHR